MTAPIQLSIRKKLLFTVSICLGTIFVASAVAELGLRWRHGAISRITGVTDWSLDSWEGTTYYWDAYHPHLGWTNVAGYRSDERIPCRVTINGQHLRATRDYSPRPQPPLRRIAVFGDSCAFGEEVNDDETICAWIERGFTNAEALNYGVHGYGLGQMLLRLEEEGFDLAPDHVVIVIYVPSDIFRDSRRQFCHNKPVFSATGQSLSIGNVPVPLGTDQPWVIRHSFVAAWLAARPGETYDPEDVESHAQLARAILGRIRRLCAERGTPLTIVTMTLAGNLDLMGLRPPVRKSVELLRRAIRECGVDTLDLVDDLKSEHSQSSGMLVAPSGHWSSAGNHVIANRIVDHLTRLDPDWHLAEPENSAKGSHSGQDAPSSEL